MTTEFHEGDMARELAEYEAHSMPFSELLQWAYRGLEAHWLRRATEDPEAVRKAYEFITQETHDAMQKLRQTTD